MMENDGKIYIVITRQKPSGPTGVGSGDADPDKKQPSGTDSLFAHWARQRLLDTTRSLAKSTIMYGLSNVGNFTGNYMAQAQINNSVHALSGIASLGMTALAGFKVGGPVGAAIATGLAIVNQTAQWVMGTYSGVIENQKTNYEIARLRDRSGLNTLLDGSRGTES